MMTEAKVAYYAGLFDGEGCVGIKASYTSSLARERKWRTLALDVCIANTKSDEEYAIRLGMKQRLSEMKWTNYTVGMHGMEPNSGNGENPNPEPSMGASAPKACAETMGLRQSLFHERQEIVHPNGN